MAPKKSKTVSQGEVPYFGLTKFLVIKLALPHVCLWSLSTLYCIGGALMFMHLERRESLAASQYVNWSINRTTEAITWKLYNLTLDRVNETHWKAVGDQTMKGFVTQIYELHKKLDQSTVDAGVVDKWAFGRAFFFTATTLTSIGYGNQTPSTRSGKVFCIFYALFGLPLVVITIADIAKFLSHFIIWCFIRYMMLKWKIRAWYRTWRVKQKERRESLRLQRLHGLSPQAAAALVSPKGRSDEEVAEFLWVNLVNAEFVEVPASLMFALITIYVSLGGLYFRSVEKDWTFFEGFYFSLISILAIGFGDYTPRNERYIYLSLIYVVMGIVLTTTCIDIVGVDYINKLHFWGRQLHKVDPLQWLKEVQERRLRSMKQKAMAALINTLTALHYMRLDPALLNNMKTLLVENPEPGDGPRSPRANMITSPMLPPPNQKELEQQQQAKRQQQLEAISLAVQAAAAQKSDLKSTPSPPRNFRAISISVHSVTLKWDPPLTGLTDDMYYSISYRLRSVCDRIQRRDAEADRKPAALTRQQSTVHSLVASSIGLMRLPPECMELSDLDETEEEEASGASTSRSSFRFRLAPRRAGMTGIEHVPNTTTTYTVNGLKSFALYQFCLVAINKNGRSRSVHTQEYTEPSTVPLNIRAASISDTVAKIVWDPPARNKLGPRRYTIHVTSDATIPFSDWEKIETAPDEHQIDLSELAPMTSYVICVSANHNRGLATFSRSLQLATLASPVDNTQSGVGDMSKEEGDSLEALDSTRLSSRHSMDTWSLDLRKSESGAML